MFKTFSGTVVDSYYQTDIVGESVSIGDTIVYTDHKGYFRFTARLIYSSIGTLESDIRNLTVYTLQGKYLQQFTDYNSASSYLKTLPQANYAVIVTYTSGDIRTMICNAQSDIYTRQIVPTTSRLKSDTPEYIDTLSFSKSGFFKRECPVRGDSIYEMLALSYPRLDYLHSLICPEAFDMVKGLPLLPKQTQISSVKVIYSLKTDSLYYVNSNTYTYHYDFVKKILHYRGDEIDFYAEYTDSPRRSYILATLNFYQSSNTWGLEFFSGDMLSCTLVEKMYDAIVSSAYFGNDLKLVINADKFNTCNPAMPTISQDEINSGQNYQALNICKGYGYLRKIKKSELSNANVKRHDIVVLDSLPLDINPVAGIITMQFQTPLCHINLLSHNRGTPNMALRSAWNDNLINSLENTLVFLDVELDSFVLRQATIAEATSFWNQNEPSKPTTLLFDTLARGLVSLDTASIKDIISIGGKASNFAELYKTACYNSHLSSIPMPEGAFAIPFYYYAQHLKKNKIDSIIASILSDTLFKTNISYRQNKLSYIRDLIKNAPLDSSLINMVKTQIASNGFDFTYYRFRSSTNTEDIEDFNGAGLYDSYTGSLTDASKPIAKAIKKVWASLWNFNAFEEREYFKINHLTTQMGILVHRSFPDETANGVVISSIMYDRPDIPYPGVTINAQFGENSITNPVDDYTTDQIICYTFSINPSVKYMIEYMGHSNVFGENNQTTVLTDEEITLLTDICLDVKYHFSRKLNHAVNVDIEFKIDTIDGVRKLYIKQARTY